jgi:chromosome partitioning protein
MASRVIAFGNRKGGVGKTSSLLGIGAALADAGENVLVIDLDAQADATTTLGVEPGVPDRLDVFDVLYAGEEGTLDQAIVPTAWERVWAVPGSKQLSRIDSETMMTPEFRLSIAATDADLSRFDHVLVDLPPNLGRLTLNGLIYADQVFVISESGRSAARGVQEFMEVIGTVTRAKHLNPSLEVAGIIVNAVNNPQTSDDQHWIGQLREAYGDMVLEPLLYRRTAVKDAQAAGLPITQVASEGGRAMTWAYREHAKRLMASEAVAR